MPNTLASSGATQLKDAEPCPSCSGRAGTALFSGRDRLRGEPGEFTGFQCAKCGVVRVEPAPEPDPAALSLASALDGDPGSLFRRLLARARQLGAGRLARMAQSGAPGGGSALDLGGGPAVSSALHKRGLEVVATAPAGQPVSPFFASAGVPVVRSHLPETCFRKGRFNVVVCKHPLAQQPDPNAALKALRELLADDGSIVIEVPNANSWQALLLGEAWAGFDIPRHPITFDLESLDRLLKRRGLSIARSRPGSSIEAALLLATSLCPGLDPHVRRVRGKLEHPIAEAGTDICYCLLTAALLPLALVEAVSGSGPTLVVEARRTPRRTRRTQGGEAQSGTGNEA